MLVAGVTLCVAGGGAVVVGFAAGLGALSSETLGSFSEALAPVVPQLVTCDNFDAGGGSLSGRAVSSAASCGSAVWTVHVGTWSVGSGLVDSDGTTDGVATLDVGLTNVRIEAMITGADSGSRAGGVVVDHDGGSTYLAAVLVGDSPVRVDLILMSAGVPTTVATANVTVGPSSTLSLTRDGSLAIVHLDGLTVVSYTLSAGDSATLGSSTRAGLYASSLSVQFDNLRVTTPPPG